eukprot:gene51475-29109_t
MTKKVKVTHLPALAGAGENIISPAQEFAAARARLSPPRHPLI